MRFSDLLISGFLFVGLLAGCSPSKPDDADVTAALTSEFGAVASIGSIERLDGIAYPAGGGAPESYVVEIKATLVPPGPITVHLANDLNKKTRIKAIVAGHEPDPKGMNAMFDMSTHRWRTDESRPVVVTGTIRFFRAESGWRTDERVFFLVDELMEAGSMPVRRFEVTTDGVRDIEQNLIWARSDNGSDITWESALSYCAGLGKGWTLPSVAEVQSIYDASGTYASEAYLGTVVPATPLITISSGLMWANDPRSRASGRGRAAHLLEGGRDERFLENVDGLFMRALCVRRN